MLIGGVLWFALPERREAHAKVLIRAIQPGVLPTPIYDPVEYATFKRTQEQMVKSGIVLRAVVRDPSIMKLKTIKAHNEDPVQWLEDRLTVTFPNDAEVMQIGLRGDTPADSVRIVDAVVDKYMSECVGEDKSRRAAYQQNLEKQYRVLSDEHQRATAALAVREKQVSAAGSQPALAQKQVATRNLDDALSTRNQIRQKVRDLALRIELEKAKSQREVKTSDEEQVRSPDLWTLEKEHGLQEAELATAEEAVAASVRALSQLKTNSAELDQVRSDLQNQRQILNELAEKLHRQRVEQFAPERITKIDPATIGSGSSPLSYLGPAILSVGGLVLIGLGAWPKGFRRKAIPAVQQN
jgi:hypothetical protein